MFGFRWTKMFLQPILLLHFTGLTRQDVVSVIVREGGDVTLPCQTVTNDLHNCAHTTWSLSPTPTSSARNLFVHGQTVETAKAKSDRLSVTENCSLVVKKVTVEDVGRYICNDSLDLSVIKVTEHKDDDKVTLNCSAWTRGRCSHTVKWLFANNDVGTDHKDLKTTQSNCSSNVTFTTSHFIYTSRGYNLLKCNVTDGYSRKVQQFTLKSKPSGSRNKETPTEPERDIPQQSHYLWWLYVVAAAGSAALLITVVALIRRKRNKGNKSQREENMADPEDVSYASISFTKKTNSKARVRGADEVVTYSTVKTPSSSAGASIDPKSLYATIN
ncbi:uncharacterized protein LOC119013007 [Acanthopagrus latus]|uniref:uncharacterized protein LOC119013007 n=1 Tax=Acanthopagrus latus TaxID=8177 RepID=UPI00187BF613|nr:uncharacterized protein LOC119013007 [Acanthopagrus latus]